MRGGSFESVTWTRFSRFVRFVPKYSSMPLFSFLSWTRLFSSRIFLSSTANSPTILAMQVPAARLMLWSRPGRWLRSIRRRCWRRSTPGRVCRGIGDHKRGMCVGTGSDNRGAQPVNDRPTGSLGHSVNNSSTKAVPSFYRVNIRTQQ